MKKRSAIILLVALAGVLFAADSVVDPIPDPVSNNAVAMLKVHGQLLLFSFMGIGPKKTPGRHYQLGLFPGSRRKGSGPRSMPFPVWWDASLPWPLRSTIICSCSAVT